MAALLTSIPPLNLLCFVIYPAAGFASAAAYRKRVERSPTVREGAKLGWMTGVISFAFSLILFAAASLAPGSPGLAGGLDRLREQFEESGQPELAERITAIAGDPAALALVLFFGLSLSFAVTAGLTAVGGALGAKVLDKD